MLLQKLPDHGGHADTSSEESWNRAVTLADTLKPEELRELGVDTIIKRLFWEETLLTFEPQSIRWHCPCTRERVGNMLRMLGRDEVESILTERETVDVSCNFCGKPYQFDAVDCASLFTHNPDSAHAHPRSIH